MGRSLSGSEELTAPASRSGRGADDQRAGGDGLCPEKGKASGYPAAARPDLLQAAELLPCLLRPSVPVRREKAGHGRNWPQPERLSPHFQESACEPVRDEDGALRRRMCAVSMILPQDVSSVRAADSCDCCGCRDEFSEGNSGVVFLQTRQGGLREIPLQSIAFVFLKVFAGVMGCIHVFPAKGAVLPTGCGNASYRKPLN